MVHARHFGGLSADQRAAGLAAANTNAGDNRRADLRFQPAAGKVVEEEKGLGALDHQIIDRHGHQVDADRVVTAGFDRDLSLVPTPSVGGDQDGSR